MDGGRTTLTSAALDATGMTVPTVSFWRWFCSYWPLGTSSGTGGPEPGDYLAVLISNDNGVNWTPVDTTRGDENHWEERTIRVADYVTPTSQVRLRFVAHDVSPGSIVEAGVDDLTMFDAASAALGVTPPRPIARLAFRPASPNPAAGRVTLVLEVPASGELEVDLVDVTGRRVRELHRGLASAGPLTLGWDGRDGEGRPAPAGLYFARARAGNVAAHTRVIRIR